jgi:elongation factor 3
MEKTINFSSKSSSYISRDDECIISLEHTKKLMKLEKKRLIDIFNSELNEETLDLISEINLSENISCYEYIVLDIFQKILPIFENKKKKDLYAKCYSACINCIDILNEWTYMQLFDIMILKIKNTTKEPLKENCLLFIDHITNKNPNQIKNNLIKLFPVVIELVYSVKKRMSTMAENTLLGIAKCNGNTDLDPFIPIVINSLKNLDKISEAVEALAGCVFVQNIESSALSITAPILRRGLKNEKTETRRKSCVIIDNMCKLVEHPKEILPLIDELRSNVENCAQNISNPEARNIAEKSLATINKACGDNPVTVEKKVSEFKELIINNLKLENICIDNDRMIEYISYISTNMCNSSNFTESYWVLFFNRYLNSNMESIAINILNSVKTTFILKEDIFEDTEEGLDLYKGDFSLAYGALTLLNNTHIHLKKNRFYGLLGPNNCGKTTLMRAIANEQVEGFPKKDELKTIFVEHEIQEREVGEDDKGYPIFNIDLCGIDWVVDCCNEIYKMEPLVKREDVEKVMEEIGFGNSNNNSGKDRAADAAMGVTTYSGGWKMKMQLCAATLMNADILMLDEPTGHLDVKNIAWIKEWLSNFKDNGGSIITTSHDSAFLDDMCTHIIDFESRKLRMFRGNKGSVLREFVNKYPEKKGYFELKNDVMKFEFPEPQKFGNKKIGSILKMSNVTFTYPIRDTPTVINVSLTCSTSSRVAVIGPNGAGKSTAIKLLIGELKPTEGVVWRNPNGRIAYVAQHAFQHLEKHIKKTPTQYILWRFAGNEDKESLEFRADEEEQIIKYNYMLKASDVGYELKKCNSDTEKKLAVKPDYLMGRKVMKKEKTKEYEVKWVGKPREQSMWVKREILVNMGALVMVQRYDEKLAAEEGLMTKTLTSSSIEKHLRGFGIEPEQASHTLIGSLSGGQKVKVVLAASMWLNPHLVILDEPTNYLDRDGLGALTVAIDEFKGGVVIISHNREFANAVSQEKWIMEKGRLRKEGESLANLEEEKEGEGNTIIQDNVFTDASGNQLQININKVMSDKEKKSKVKKLMKKLKKDKTLTEEERWDIEDEIEELEK